MVPKKCGNSLLFTMVSFRDCWIWTGDGISDFSMGIQEPKLEVSTIYKAYFSGLSFREYPHKIWPEIWYVYVPPCIGSWRSPVDFLSCQVGLNLASSPIIESSPWSIAKPRLDLRQRTPEMCCQLFSRVGKLWEHLQSLEVFKGKKNDRGFNSKIWPGSLVDFGGWISRVY